mmetsp:Transcript_3336/g.7704  ORF Transcript_3336/g.7704 Transcript_3336/m.7704 type:complete len:247 (+) Transcript_3336:2186-2926(+)
MRGVASTPRFSWVWTSEAAPSRASPARRTSWGPSSGCSTPPSCTATSSGSQRGSRRPEAGARGPSSSCGPSRKRSGSSTTLYPSTPPRGSPRCLMRRDESSGRPSFCRRCTRPPANPQRSSGSSKPEFRCRPRPPPPRPPSNSSSTQKTPRRPSPASRPKLPPPMRRERSSRGACPPTRYFWRKSTRPIGSSERRSAPRASPCWTTPTSGGSGWPKSAPTSWRSGRGCSPCWRRRRPRRTPSTPRR